jgi:hypothetical protein
MVKRWSCLFLLFYLFSCGQDAEQVKSAISIDATQPPEDGEIDLKNMRENYVLSYNNPIVFESEHKGKSGEKIIVIGKYYCLFDSSIIVPGKYNLDDTTKSFRTHNFAEDVTIIINGDTSIRKTITKKLLTSTLPQHLKEYAVLLEPQFEGYDDETETFDFNFSISVPLSDVGEARKLTIRKDGTAKVSNPE